MFEMTCYFGIFPTRYDFEYMKHYTGLDVKRMPAYSGFYTKGNPFNPTKSEILFVSHDNDLETSPKFNITPLKEIYPDIVYLISCHTG